MNTKNRLIDFEKLRFEIRDAMRYDDVGDYFDNTIVAYNFNDPVIQNAIFLHEFIEFSLIKSAGITPELIDRFDTQPESEKEFPKEFAAYEKFHELANKIERQFIENLGINWEEYDEKIYTTKVTTAIQKVSDDLHDANPSETDLQEAKDAVKEVLEK